MAWEVEYTDQFGIWWNSLLQEEQRAIRAAVAILENQGPGLGRPFVDSVHSSRHSNMKELRPHASTIRILFAFDPRRVGILLIGGDKSGRWRDWYQQMIPVADQLYDEHLLEIRREDR